MSSGGWGLWSKDLARAGMRAPSPRHVQLLPGALPRLPSENFLGQGTLSWRGQGCATETLWSLQCSLSGAQICSCTFLGPSEATGSCLALKL